MDTVRRAIHSAVRSFCGDRGLRRTLLCALRRPGYALDPGSRCRSGRLVLEVYRAIRGPLTTEARIASAAVELQMGAAFLLDDVADDRVPDGWRLAEELAVAIALLICGNGAAAEAARRAGRAAALRPFCRSGLTACRGQWLDSRLERENDVTTDEACRLASLKSGALGRMAAGFAARLATDDPGLICRCERLGSHLFTYAQLVDDLRDACRPGVSCDLSERKKTVPVVYFRHEAEQAGRTLSDGRIAAHDIRERYRSSGAALFGALVAEGVLNRAKAVLEQLRRRRCAVEGLEQFVTSLEHETAPTVVGAVVEGV